MFSQQKPRFNLSLSINELSNIPQISGYCFIELYIHNSSKEHWFGSTHIPAGNKDHKSRVNSIRGNHVHVTTKKSKIHNFRCAFHDNINCNLKFPYNSSQNLVGNKYLSLRVYYVPHHDSADVSVIGQLNVNLTEYLNFTDVRTSKYLLKESKVNSILSLSVLFKELDPNQEFHTSLAITENKQGLSNNVKGNVGRQTTFNIPQFDRKNVFGGIDNVIAPSSPSSSKLSAETSSEDERHSNQSAHGSSGHASSQIKRSGTVNSDSNLAAQTINRETVQQMDPIVSSLYHKVLESTWDPALKPLLNYNAEKVVQDIFDGKNPDEFKNWDSYSGDDDHSNFRNMNGLISETKVRSDLRSWSVRDSQTQTASS